MAYKGSRGVAANAWPSTANAKNGVQSLSICEWKDATNMHTEHENASMKLMLTFEHILDE
jgi:hypothetical protein